MKISVTTARGVVYVSHHLLYLQDDEVLPEPPFASSNGLIMVRPGIAVIFTGISSGPVNVHVEVRLGPPARVEPAGWDDAVDVSLNATTGRVRVTGPMVDPPPLPALTTAGPGDYRVRVYARGRDAAPDVAVFEPVEDYRIMVWPAQPTPEYVHKQTSTFGAMLCRLASTERP